MAARPKFGRSLLVAGVLTVVAVPVTAGAAYAGVAPHPHNPPGHHTHGAHVTSAHHPTTTLTTVVPDAHIRSKTTTAKRSHVIATLRTRGEKVEVTCHKTGMPVGGDSTWYKTVTPARGYIAAAMVDHPTTAVPLCKKKP
jgi:hypothetical protein